VTVQLPGKMVNYGKSRQRELKQPRNVVVLVHTDAIKVALESNFSTLGLLGMISGYSIQSTDLHGNCNRFTLASI